MPETGDDRNWLAAVAIFVKASQDVEKPLVTVCRLSGDGCREGSLHLSE